MPVFEPAYDLVRVTTEQVKSLFVKYHGYKGVSGIQATYAFAVVEDGEFVAAYVWQPPPPGAAKAICPEAPQGVLALSRMVAVPQCARRLKHISKPLRKQMRQLIDRTRWPVLVTYSDEGQGHTGHVYKCSGWEKTERNKRNTLTTTDGTRISSYQNGAARDTTGLIKGTTFIQRWEHWVCDRGTAHTHMREGGWVREPIPGKTWKSGTQAFRWKKVA